jgi:hypothetical protein
MRKLLGRKAVIIIAAIISVTAIPAAGVVATATPAQAATFNICELNGHNYCIGDPGTVSNGDAVVLTGPTEGRLINEVYKGYTCCGGWSVYQLQFVTAPSQCVGVASGAYANVTVRDCSGGNSNNTNWARRITSSGYVQWLNSNEPTYGLLTGRDKLGSQLIGAACTGCFYTWNN